jgi:hypothetical protein
LIGDLKYEGKISVVEYKPQNIPLDRPFQPFKDIIISANSEHRFPEVTIQFLCVNLTKCRRNNDNGLAFEFKILNKTLSMTDGKRTEKLPFNHNLWESFEIKIHASQHDYSINYGNEVITGFPTPIHIDSVNINQGNITLELREVKPV